ncbi:MAG: trypsin-like serine protease [Deltaproteobacteria bacterium]|nr:trypsin-like serine protease [Deltaproteobacteria bacterium]
MVASRVALVGSSLALVAGCVGPAPATDEQASAIVNGITDSNHRYVVGVGGATRAFCTGTVISRRTVLTAGHCIGGVRNIFIGTSINGGAGTKIPVVEEIQHPMYRDLPNQNATFDLGILHLGADAPVQPAPLFRDTMANTPRFIGPSLVFSGFGATSGSGAGFGTKRVTTFPIHVVGPAVVGNSYPAPDNLPAELFYYLDTETMNRNTCNGDSGGPAFFIEHGVEWLIGVTSSGDASCALDGADQRSDQPYIDDFIQPHIDEFEPGDPCRSNGVCDETCNHDGQVGDPDCAAAHCAADGMCAEACTAPLDPDCAAIAANNCGDNGVCDPTCASDPDCARQCGAEGNCIPGCGDPDCAGEPVTPDAAPATPDAAPAIEPDAGGAGLDDSADDGCGCRAGARPERAAAPLLVLGLAALRRRRRR